MSASWWRREFVRQKERELDQMEFYDFEAQRVLLRQFRSRGKLHQTKHESMDEIFSKTKRNIKANKQVHCMQLDLKQQSINCTSYGNESWSCDITTFDREWVCIGVAKKRKHKSKRTTAKSSLFFEL